MGAVDKTEKDKEDGESVDVLGGGKILSGVFNGICNGVGLPVRGQMNKGLRGQWALALWIWSG